MRISFFIIVFCTVSIWGQNKDERKQADDNYYRIEQLRKRQDELADKDKNGMIVKRDVITLQSKADSEQAREAKEIYKGITDSIRLLEVPDIYVNKYKSFLKMKNTGIARVFPDKNCQAIGEKKVISVEEIERCRNVPQIIENGSLYSFRLGKNYVGLTKKLVDLRGWWDIHFIDQNFVVGNCCMQSMISNLGNLALEDLNINSPALSYITSFKAKKNAEEIQKQNQILNKGIESNGYTYQKKVSARINDTYAVRSISYTPETVEKGKEKILKLISDDVVVFSVAEIESSGSLILLWRKLPIKK